MDVGCAVGGPPKIEAEGWACPKRDEVVAPIWPACEVVMLPPKIEEPEVDIG
jgi:hypothetical protein